MQITAKLVLVECSGQEALDSKRRSIFRKDASTFDIYDLTIHFEPHQTPNAKFYKPILISETEKIEVGDYAYNYFGKELIQFNNEKACELANNQEKRFHFKVLSLPQYFSPEHLQAIVTGKIKDGDKVLVECEVKMIDPCDNPACNDGKCSKKGKMEVCESRYDEINVIKLNSSNYIILHHKVEEKMVPISLVEKAYNAGINSTQKVYEVGGMEWYLEKNKKEWFEQNIDK